MEICFCHEILFFFLIYLCGMYMVFKDIDSKLEPSYNSANDDIVNDFYNLASFLET